MARCLSVHLIKYLKSQEEDLMQLTKQKDMEIPLVMRYNEILKISVEDLTREYSPMDIRELCLRTKVRVNMTRYNCVHDAKRRFLKRGRHITNSLLVKAVGKIVEPYTEQEIAVSNHIFQCQLKKDNNFRLDRWHLASSSLVLGRSNTPISDYLPPAQVTGTEMANDENIVSTDLSDDLEWIDEALRMNGDAELAAFDAFFSKPEMQGKTSSGVFSCISDSLENDDSLNDKAITEWFLEACQQLEHVELVL